MKLNRQYIIIIIVLQLVSGLLGLLGNIAVNSFSEEWKPYFWIAWPLFGVFTVALIGILIWQEKIGADEKKRTGTKGPSELTHSSEGRKINRYPLLADLPSTKQLDKPLDWEQLRTLSRRISIGGLARNSGS